MLFPRRNAEAVILVLGLLIAMTPIWRWASLPASPTAEEVRQLICAAPRDGPIAQRPEASRSNASQLAGATTPAP
ncbi:hypothetical protein M2282_000630 [Variovorax boronicumulans]|uniref:hypothetical protein n=1 Tax=Variovorax boronicumulans TaxID=436515 RepID=UPI002473CBE4|nr:hypothetical protein [Variovorax boronicumulans]MDH6165502.1 hypothetical protein [Variovorax boronicumulans]